LLLSLVVLLQGRPSNQSKLIISPGQPLTRIPRDLTKSQPKWLNVVLELNGLLCSIAPLSEAPAECLRFPDANFPPVFSATVPTIVAGIVVYCRPRLQMFLKFLSLFANIHVWSTLPAKVVHALCAFLFSKLDGVPQVVLASFQCDTLLLKNYARAMYPGTHDPLLLKYPRRRLFTRRDANINENNLLILDCNPATCFAVPTKNYFIPDRWSHSNPDTPVDVKPLNGIGELCVAVHLNGPQNFSEVMRLRRPSHNDLSENSYLYQILSRNLPYVWNQDLVTGKKKP